MRLLLLITALILLSGCTIGVRTEYRVVYAGIAKTPDNMKGLIRIATNKAIDITIQDASEPVVTKKDLGGYYVISGSDLSTLIDAAKTE